MKPILSFLLCLSFFAAGAQTYAPVKTSWQNAGYRGTKPAFTQTVSILDHGADNIGTTPTNTALTNAINALGGKPGVIFFPAGTYFFNAAVTINRDSIIFRGAGYDSTRLRFDLAGGVTNLVSVSGASAADTTSLMATAVRGTTAVAVANAAAFRSGDWVTLSMNDQAYTTSAWAYGSLSQLMQVQSVSGNTITFSSPFRFNYTLADQPFIRKSLPRNNVGFECLKIQRADATAGQASNIVFDGAVNCWVSGIESDSANFAHIEVNHSSNIEVTNSYIHHAFAYGGNGQGYGVLLQFGSNECKVEANYFYHLRHSMLLQAGANGNVLAYNYSADPFWTEPSLPDSSAGEIVLHGNYPFMNLAEGNFISNIVIDDSHGKNGPLNTFFRNRAEGYGLFMNFNPATDSQQFIGNEITNNAIGLNFIQGAGHFIYGNNYRGAITSGSAGIPDTSLYLPAGQKPPCPAGYDAWPVVGRPGGYNTGTIYAKARVLLGKPAACACVSIPVATGIPEVTAAADWSIAPNPAYQDFEIKGHTGIVDRAEVYNMAGMLMLAADHPAGNIISVARLAPGMYVVRIMANGQTAMKKLVRY